MLELGFLMMKKMFWDPALSSFWQFFTDFVYICLLLSLFTFQPFSISGMLPLS